MRNSRQISKILYVCNVKHQPKTIHSLNPSMQLNKQYVSCLSFKFIMAVSSIFITHLNNAQEINRSQAKNIAQHYVRKQGFTDIKMEVNNTEIDTLTSEKYFNLNEKSIKEFRQNTIKSKAFYSKRITKGWLIGFRYTKAYRKREKKLMESNPNFKTHLNKLMELPFLPKVKSKNEFALIVTYNTQVTVLPYSDLKYYAKKYKLNKKE